jgi:hypothetical protein
MSMGHVSANTETVSMAEKFVAGKVGCRPLGHVFDIMVAAWLVSEFVVEGQVQDNPSCSC